MYTLFKEIGLTVVRSLMRGIHVIKDHHLRSMGAREAAMSGLELRSIFILTIATYSITNHEYSEENTMWKYLRIS